mgnify:FL=1
MPILDFMFTAAPIFIFTVFVIVIGTILFFGIQSLREWIRNNRQEILSDHVRVTDKRTHVWGGHHNQQHHAHTSYYITFEFEDGERREFMVSGRAYGLVSPGDAGTLTWQGTRFHDFQRVREY